MADFYHWLDLETGDIEFRPVENRWQSSASSWYLTVDRQQPGHYTMRRGGKTLIDLHSGLSSQIFNTLGTLDNRGYIHIMQSADGTIEAELIRLRLRFFINRDGLLECKEFAATVDSNQDIGCFYGLVNKLVLKDSAKEATGRSVVVPYGGITISQNTPCALVTITPLQKESCVRYFRYRLNEHLRTLQGPHDILPSLYRCYLHAITGYVLPDPFTGRLGTDEALRGLRQQCLKSAAPLDTDCISMLNNMAALTPTRNLYPEHLREMQTVRWNSSLSQLSQHDEFYVVTEDIIRYTSRFSSFHMGISQEKPYCCGDSGLLERARKINSRWRCGDFGGTPAPSREEVIYKARDVYCSSERGQRVYETASLIRDWPAKVHCADILQESENWETISAKELDGTCTGEYNLSFTDSFGSLYNFCRHSKQGRDSFKLMSLFSMVSFGNATNAGLIRAFLAIAFSGQFQDLSIPSSQNPKVSFPFHLSAGEDFVLEDIQKAIKDSCAPFRASNTYLQTWEEAEIAQAASDNHNREVSAMVDECCRQIESQWPCISPVLQRSSEIRRIDLAKASRLCRELCKTWRKNEFVMSDIRVVQKRLQAFQTSEVRQYTVDPPCRHVEPKSSLVPSQRSKHSWLPGSPQASPPIGRPCQLSGTATCLSIHQTALNYARSSPHFKKTLIATGNVMETNCLTV